MIKITLSQQCNLLIILTLEFPAKAFLIIYFSRRICICFCQSVFKHGRLQRHFDSWLDMDYFNLKEKGVLVLKALHCHLAVAHFLTLIWKSLEQEFDLSRKKW